mgnify:FL=1
MAVQSEHFRRNLRLGKKAEVRAMELLKSQYPTIHLAPESIKGSFKDYDLIDNEGNTFEVKSDTMSKDTGNIAIEFESWGSASSIMATKAMFWFQFYYLDGWVYSVCSVEDLRHFLKFGGFTITVGGEDMQSKMYLVPTYKFANEFGCISLPTR